VNWPMSAFYAPDGYGGVTDTWNQDDSYNWSADAVNSDGFGVAVSALGYSGTAVRTASIDHIRMTITYRREFYIFDVGDPSNPVFTNGLGSNSGTSTGFNGVVSDGRYAYLLTNSGSTVGQLQIADLSVNPSSLVKFSASNSYVYAIPGISGTAVGESIFYKDGYVYIGLSKTGGGPEFNIIDVHNPSSPFRAGSKAVGRGINSIMVKGRYAYLGTDDNSRELVIYDVANPADPRPAGIYNADSDTLNFGYGRSLYGVGNTLYFGRTWIQDASEFSILDAKDPLVDLADPGEARKFDVGPDGDNPFSVKGLVVRDYLAFLLVGSKTKGGSLRILDISDPDHIVDYTQVGLENGSAGPGGVALDCEKNYLYAASVDENGKGYLYIITGQ